MMRWDDAILSKRFAGYALYRLRGVFLSTLFGTSAHVIELWLLFQWFASGSLHRALSVKIALAAVAGAHFGALEILRRRLRAHRSRRPLDVWWTLNVAAAVLTITGALVWFVASEHTVVDAYVLVYYARAAVDLPLRTLHSGVYAFGRVRRPLALVPVIELSGLAIVWFGARTNPALWLIIGLVVTSVLSRAATAYYAVAAYRSRHRALPRLIRHGLRRYALAALPRVALASVAGLALRTAELSVILFLLRGTVPFEDPLQLTLFLFLFAPILAVATGSAQAFYPDLVIAAAPRRRWIAHALRRRLRVIAAIIGVLTVAFGFLPFFVLPFGDLLPIWIVLAPATIVLASWSYEQMMDFAAGRFLRVIARVAAVCGVALIALYLPRPLALGPSLAAGGALVALLVFAFVYRARHAVDPRSWSALARSVRAPAIVTLLHVPRLGVHAVAKLAIAVSGFPVARGRIAVVTKAASDELSWAIKCGGWLERVQSEHVTKASDVTAAITKLRDASPALDLDALAAAEPEVWIIDLARGGHRALRMLPENERKAVLSRVFEQPALRIPGTYLRVIVVDDAPRFVVLARRDRCGADVGARIARFVRP